MNKIIPFIKSSFERLIKRGSGYSSRTYVALLLAHVIALIAIIDLFTDFSVNEYIWWGLITTYAAAHGLSTMSTNKSIEIKQKEDQQ